MDGTLKSHIIYTACILPLVQEYVYVEEEVGGEVEEEEEEEEEPVSQSSLTLPSQQSGTLPRTGSL